MLYAMSDIHGYLRPLREALKKIGSGVGDWLVLLADYIDYGPDSGQVAILAFDETTGKYRSL